MRDPGAERGHEPGSEDRGHHVPEGHRARRAVGDADQNRRRRAKRRGEYVDDCRGERNQVHRIPRTPQQGDRRQHAGEDQQPLPLGVQMRVRNQPACDGRRKTQGQQFNLALSAQPADVRKTRTSLRDLAHRVGGSGHLFYPWLGLGLRSGQPAKREAGPNQSASHDNQNDHIQAREGQGSDVRVKPRGAGWRAALPGPGSGPGEPVLLVPCT